MIYKKFNLMLNRNFKDKLFETGLDLREHSCDPSTRKVPTGRPESKAKS